MLLVLCVLRGNHGCAANWLQQFICWASGVLDTSWIWLVDVLISLPMIDSIRLMVQAYTGELRRLFGRRIGYGAAFSAPEEQRGGIIDAADAEAGMRLSGPLLEGAALISRSGHGEEAWRRRRKLISEWDTWRQGYPLAVRPSFEGSHPWDVLAFLEHWRGRHSGRSASAAGLRRDGCAAAPLDVAPGTLRATASHLSRIFEGVGRDGPWSESRPGGNPVSHAVVKLYLKGYDSHAFHDHDYSSSGAVPVDAGQHGALMRHLLAKAGASASAYERALSLRDACAFAYLWETGQRGKECCRLRLKDFCYADKLCSDAWADIRAGALPRDRTVLVECSAGTKTRRTKHPGTLELAYGWSENPGCSLCEVLPQYAQAVEACGQALECWLFPPSNGSHDGFEVQRAVSSGALNRRLQQHLREIGRWQGESLHGIRRGSTQHAYAEGDQDIGRLARKRLWAQTESLEDYLHVTRHKQRLATRPLPEGAQLGSAAISPGTLRYARKGALFGTWG